MIFGIGTDVVQLARVEAVYARHGEHFGSTSLSGAAGGVLLALVWLYYVSQMILVGAHFTRVLDERHDRT